MSATVLGAPRARASAAVLRALVPWAAAAVVLAALPYVFPSALGLTIMNQMGISIVFALSYNMLLGQGGMLSFGHAVYFGLGGFFAMHLINFVEHDGWTIPLPVQPLLAGLFGLAFAVVVGSFSTRRAGTVFAMISLGIGELVAACSIIFVAFFGGEEGISGDRTMGPSVLGYEFVSEIEIYTLIAVFVWVCALAMYSFSRTPAGRMANAVRDNPERAEFIGYSQRAVRFISFCVSGYFAGVAGGLFAINYEILTEENLNLVTSGWVLLMVYIGGAGFFMGPVVGAVLLTLLQTVLSNYTEIWQLYVGILFVLTVMYLPSGLTGLIAMHGPAARSGRARVLIAPYAAAALPLALFLVGSVALLELLHAMNGAAVGVTSAKLFGYVIDLHGVLPWALAISSVAVGIAGLRATARGVREAFEQASGAPGR